MKIDLPTAFLKINLLWEIIIWNTYLTESYNLKKLKKYDIK